MNTLALDCSFGGLTLALQAHGQVFSRILAETRASDRLLPLLAELLEESQLNAADLSVVAATVGPGSFTGIRLGLAVAEGLKLVNPGLQIIGLPTLAVLAAQIAEEHAPKTAFTLLLDAAGGQVYRQDFSATGQAQTQPVCEPLASLKSLQTFIAAQTGLLPPFPTHATFTTANAGVLLKLAADKTHHVPATPLYLKELGYRHANAD